MILDVEQNPSKVSHWILFTLQHVLAVLVATITVPLLVPGMPLAATMVSAGIGGLTFKFGDVSNPTIQITSTASAMILGIILNLVLKEKKNKN